jgi:hypothetical protein
MISKRIVRVLVIAAASMSVFAGAVSSATAGKVTDLTPPVVSITPLINDATADSTPTLSFTATDNSATITATCQFDQNAPAPCTSPITAPLLADGSHALSVVASDMSGNNSVPVAYGFIVDTFPPTLSITAPVSGDVVTTTTPDVSFALDNGTADCKFDGGPFSTCVSPLIAPAMLNGTHTLTVRATDLAGNATERSVTFVVDDPDGDTPTSSSFTGAGGKIKKGAFIASIKVRFGLPAGTAVANACKGSAMLKIRPKSKKSKSFKKTVKLKRSGSGCAVRGKFKLPAKYKGKRLSTTLSFKGNALISKFTLHGTTKKI